MLRYLILAAGCLVIASAIVGAAFVALERTCSLGASVQKIEQRVQPNRADQSTKDTNSSQESAQPDSKTTHKPTARFDFRVTNPNEIQGNYYAEPGDGDKSDWVHKFICETKIGEFALAVFTLFLVVFTGGLWASTHRLWSVSNRQLALIETDQRAWLKFHLELDGPMVWEVNGVRIRAQAHIVNVGKSPAFGVLFQAFAYVPTKERFELAVEVRKYSEQVAQSRTSESFGGVFFPTELQRAGIQLVISNEETQSDDVLGDFFSIIIVVCVDYRLPGDDAVHQTVRAFSLGKSRASGAQGSFRKNEKETIPADRLSLYAMPYRDHAS